MAWILTNEDLIRHPTVQPEGVGGSASLADDFIDDIFEVPCGAAHE